uniref:Uncharacterized protein n=1 Tax=Triticum urartu TaxID=4572 RepID=A0A8R7UT58_TRIUA
MCHSVLPLTSRCEYYSLFISKSILFKTTLPCSRIFK